MMARLMGLATVSPAQLHQRMQREAIAIFDVNSPASFREARLPGARHLDPEAQLEGVLPQDPEQALVFYCSNPLCRKAPLAARRARKLGYHNVRVLSAGISGWLSAGLPVERGGVA